MMQVWEYVYNTNFKMRIFLVNCIFLAAKLISLWSKVKFKRELFGINYHGKEKNIFYIFKYMLVRTFYKQNIC